MRHATLKQIVYRLSAFAAIVAILTPFLNAISTRYVPGDSDGATPILEGLSILHGNYLLHGWSISLDSFWTLDSMFNAFMIKAVGFGPSLLTLVPSFIAALVIALAVLLAYKAENGLLGLVGPFIVLVCLALPSPDLSFFLLQGPWHVATTLYALLAFMILAKWRTWAGAAVASLILAIALLGDLLILDFGITAIIFAAIVAMLRERKFSAGAKTFLAGLLSMPLAICLRLIADALGTFEIVNRNLPLKLSQITSNIGFLANRIPAMFGVGSISSAPTNSDLPLEIGHIFMLILVATAVLYSMGNTIFCIFKGNSDKLDIKYWHLNDILMLGILADIVTYIVGATSNNTQYTKYLDPGVIFAVILTARVITSLLIHIFNNNNTSDSTVPTSEGGLNLAFSSLPKPSAPISSNDIYADFMTPAQPASFSNYDFFPGFGVQQTVVEPNLTPVYQDRLQISKPQMASIGHRARSYGNSDGQSGALHLKYYAETKGSRRSGFQAGSGVGRGHLKKATKSIPLFPVALLILVSLVITCIAGAVQVRNEMNLPTASQPVKGLISFLEAHHLDLGVGAYWVSSIVTVESKGEVTIRPVTNAAADKLRRYGRQSSLSWYQGKQFQFFIYNLYQPWRKVNTVSAEKTYGPPEKTLTYGPYEILIWPKPIEVSLVLPPIKNPLNLIFRN
ncbi:MAG: hypothetical protein M1374_08725 [Firmicutes bacterium]|nr:hypothetical protein [Bacillota bacterium]